ncbi:hypothetical protein Y602_127 [Burkholderia pseudomallei MSHR733]|nr:hypothetical protein BG16_104 [Burkholderia pseudomallei MSHR2543]KGW22253.1 hypothetical protein Y602_127 [Burkholderia pseudomallei MSHR733]
MGRQTTAQVKDKDRSLTVSHHETDAPLLPMAQIERLKEIAPDKVEWVFEQARVEGEFRRSETHRINTFRFVERMAGILSGLLIGVVGLGIAALLAIMGHDWVAVGIGGATLVSLVSVFVIGKAVRTPPKPGPNGK